MILLLFGIKFLVFWSNSYRGRVLEGGSVYRPSDLLKYFKMCSGDQDDFWNTSDTIGNYPYHWATETLE